MPRPAPLRHLLGGTLARLRLRRSHGKGARPVPAPDDAGLQRARAALVDARQHMPGILGDTGGSDDADTLNFARSADRPAIGLLPPPQSRAIYEQQGSNEGVLARLEEVVSQLDDERRQLSSEVAALRLIVEELRDALVRADERTSLREPTFSELSAPLPARFKPVTAPAGELETPELSPRAAAAVAALYPAGSVGVEIRLTSVADPATLESIRRALAEEPGVDMVRVTGLSDGEAGLRLYLRSAKTECQLLDLLERVAPTAKPLAGPLPGTLLLRLRPS